MTTIRRTAVIEAFDTADAMNAAAAALVAAALERSLRNGRQTATLVAIGGRTPVGLYRILRDTPLDWRRVQITLTDEHWTEPGGDLGSTEKASPNAMVVRRHLLKGAAAAASFTPLGATETDIEDAARTAELALRGLSPFDAVLLGMGEDGHIASLFPGSRSLAQGLDRQGRRLCVPVPCSSPAPSNPRLSLTLCALSNAALIVLLATGAAKRAALQAAIDGAELPVRAILTQDRARVRALWTA